MSDDPYLDGIMKRVPERAEQSQTPLASNPKITYSEASDRFYYDWNGVIRPATEREIAGAMERLAAFEHEHDALLRGRIPTHRCKICGALWILWPAGTAGMAEASWSLFSLRCGQCCDCAPMLEQIEPLPRLGGSAPETTADCSTGTGGVTLAQMAENIKHGVDPYTGDQMDIEAIRFLAAGQDDPQSMALAACANEIDRLRAKSNSRPEGLIRSEVAAEIMNAIEELIKPGKLQGSGWDETAQRNGLILAYNTISQKFGEYRAPEASPLKAEAGPTREDSVRRIYKVKNLSEKRVIEFLGWLTGDIPELHAVEAGKLLDSWKRYLARVQPVEPWGTWQQRVDLAKDVKAGDRWLQVKSGRIVVIQGPLGSRYRNCIPLLHENGAKTHKWLSYFGDQYTPESPPQHNGDSNG